jgi:hypothetical protein
MSDFALVIEDRTSPSAQTPAPKRRRKPEPQPELPSRKALDLRLAANKQFNKIVARITGRCLDCPEASDRGVRKRGYHRGRYQCPHVARPTYRR